MTASRFDRIRTLPALLILLGALAVSPVQAEETPAQNPEIAACLREAESDSTYQSSVHALPTVAKRDGLFRSTGVLPHVEQLDQLDRDVLYIRAGHLPFKELMERSTETDPPVKYRDLVPCGNLLALWKTFRKPH